MYNFNRAYELLIEGPDGVSNTFRESSINFSVRKTVLGYPNTAKIVIDNASDSTKRLYVNRNDRIQLKAGYADPITLQSSLAIIFDGQVRNIAPNREGVTSKFEIYAGDATIDFQNAYINKSYSGNQQLQAVITDVIKAMKNVGIGVLDGLANKVINSTKGFNLTGSVRDVLNRLAKEFYFHWTILDGQLVTSYLSMPAKGSNIPLVSAKTGMIGNPVITEIGVNVTTLLSPKLVVQGGFEINTDNYTFNINDLELRHLQDFNASGQYKILEVVHSGGNYSKSPWQTEVIGQRIGGELL